MSRSRIETAAGDRGVYFDVACDTECGCCDEPISAGEMVMYDEDGTLCGYVCGCGDPRNADVPDGQS